MNYTWRFVQKDDGKLVDCSALQESCISQTTLFSILSVAVNALQVQHGSRLSLGMNGYHLVNVRL